MTHDEPDSHPEGLPFEAHDRRAHARIDNLEGALAQHVEDQRLLEDAIRSTAEQTQQIVANTAEIVTLFRGAKAVRSLVVWWAPLAAAIAGAVAWLKGFRF